MKKTYLYGVMALGLLFTGCQADDLPVAAPDEISTDSERTVYVNLNIKGDASGSGSRAEFNGDPVEGTNFDAGEGESNVNKAYFVFYDVTGKQVGNGAVEVDLSKATFTDTGVSGTVEKYYRSTVGVTIGNGQENPAQVICYLNPQDPQQLDDCDLKDIQLQTRENLFSSNEVTEGEGDDATAVVKNYFSMSNSVYYTTEYADAPQIAVAIAPNQLFNSREEAQKAIDENTAGKTVNIYVERYASKLAFKSITPDAYKTQSLFVEKDVPAADVTLTFDPKTWILNASCEESYVVKSFRKESSEGGDILADNYSFAELNSIINKNGANWQWNSNDYKRSYWGMSPAYFTSVYPEVSSDVNNTTLNQKYYSYNELIAANGDLKAGKEVKTDTKVISYVHETTVGSKALISKNIVAALPSVILVGDYTVKIGTGETLTGIDFYTYGADAVTGKPIVYFAPDNNNAEGKSAVEGGESILRCLIKAATCLYKQTKDAEGNDIYVNFDITNTEDVDKLVAVLDVTRPNANVIGNLKVPERYRTLQIREGASPEQLSGIYVGTTQGYKTISTTSTTNGSTYITLLAANQEIMNNVGYAALYTAGAAYFNIPVKHFGWYRSANPNKNATEMDWSKVRVGDFGIVRNHSYDIEVNAITGIGTGIGGKDNPIVPPAEENRYYIAYRVNILQWAIVPTQSVAL